MRPKVILYNAISADGRLDGFEIDLGVYYGLISRWHEGATLVGSGTLLAPLEPIPDEVAADIEPPAKVANDPRPVLVVADSRGQVRTWHYLRKQPYWRDWVALCAQTTPQEHLDYLRERHIDYIVAGEDRIDFAHVLDVLNSEYGVEVVRADCGGTLNGVLLRAGLVDEVSLLIHPSLVGGTSPKSMFRAPDLQSPDGVIPLRLSHLERLENDSVWLVYEVVK